MQFTISREALLKPLQRVAGAVERRQALPILANILVVVKNQLLSLTATDLEIEMIARIPLSEPSQAGAVTIPGKKWMDICKALPEGATITLECTENKVILRSGRSRYTLACLGAESFPQIEESVGDIEIALPQQKLKELLDFSAFSMAQQDVRYYLNGVFLSLRSDEIRMVATDGHRLATIHLPMPANLPHPVGVIIPRKAVVEMQRLFSEGEEEIGLVVGKNHLRTITPQTSFITKLIEGKFPDYQRVLPASDGAKTLEITREPLRQALSRVCALFTDKYRGVALKFNPGVLRIIAVTPDKDEVEDELEISYQGEEVEIGVNASYLLEYLNIIHTETVQVSFWDANQAILFKSQPGTMGGQHLYVVMPMRL